MPSTVRDLTELTTVDNGDYLLVSDTSDVVNRDKRITRLNLVGTEISGGGSIATGGKAVSFTSDGPVAIRNGAPTAGYVARWYDGHKIEASGILAADVVKRIGTLTTVGHVPQFHDDNTIKGTGIHYQYVAQLNVAQAYTAKATFSAGIAFAHETLNYYDEGTWTPQVADAISGGNVATTGTSEGWYTRIGNLVFIAARIINISTAGLVGANFLYVRNAPFTSSAQVNYEAQGSCVASYIALATQLNVQIISGVNYLRFIRTTTGAVRTQTPISDLTSGTASLFFSLVYTV